MSTEPNILIVTDTNGENPQRVLTVVDLTSFEVLLGGKADAAHSHAMADVVGLVDALDAKASYADLAEKLPVTFAPYLVTNVSAGYDDTDSDRFTFNVTRVYLNPAENYPQQTFVNPVPIASDDHAGLMSKSDVAQLRLLTQGYESVRNEGVFVGVSFATKAELDEFEVPATARVNDWTSVQADETKGGKTTRYVVVNTGTAEEPVLSFAFDRIRVENPIGLAQTGIPGLIVGAADNGQNAGKGYIETDGTISIIGWNDLLSNVETIVASVVTVTNRLQEVESAVAALQATKVSVASGTFTPILGAATTAPVYTATTATGTWTRVGNTVNVSVRMVINITTAGVGALRLFQLPVAPAAGSVVTGAVVAGGTAAGKIDTVYNSGSGVILVFTLNGVGVDASAIPAGSVQLTVNLTYQAA